jgi:hypothetical protein
MVSIQIIFLLSSFLTMIMNPVLSWNPLQLHRRRQQHRPHQQPTPSSAESKTVVVTSHPSKEFIDSRLFYQNGYTDSDGTVSLVATRPSSLLINADTTAISDQVAAVTVSPLHDDSNKNNVAPRAIDLPRHSPPRQVIQRQQLLLDMEMIVGRVAMVVALILLGGEVFTGLSMTDQVTGLL